jgi:DNA-binding winged helix-turn-helix (wHTH) protein
MNVLDRIQPGSPRIDLAREPEFRVGGLQVRPSRREVEAGEVRQHLQPRVMQVLVALAHPSSDVVSQDELISRCWSGLAVGEDAVARCISQLRRVAASWSEPPFQIETIPGVGYRLSPAAAPTGGAPAPASRPQWRRLHLWIAIALAGAISGGAILALHPWRAGRAAPSSAQTPAIAVLGFQAADGSAEEKTLAASLQGRVADALSRYNVTVISVPLSSGADFTVEGRIAQRRGRLWVTTDLNDPRSRILVYSLDTVLPDDPNGDVASAIANHLALSLDPSRLSNGLRGKMTPADYTLTARINDAIERHDAPETLDQTRKLADRHPENGDLLAAMAIGAINEALQGQHEDDKDRAPSSQKPELVRLARESIVRAERLTHDSGWLSGVKGMLVNGPMGYAEKERLWRRALNLNPNFALNFSGLGGLMLTVGRTDEGAALLKRSMQVDPMFLAKVADVVHRLAKVGRVEDASEVLEREEQIWPNLSWSQGSKYAVPMYLGDARQIQALNQQSQPPPPPGSLQTLMAKTGLDQGGKAYQALVGYCAAKLPHSVPYTLDGNCLVEMVRLGRLDEAFRLAALAFPDNRGFAPAGADAWILQPPPGLDTGWLFSPAMKPFRDDPRFWDVAVRTGLVNYWQSTGFWPDFCQPQPDACKRLAAASALARPTPPMRG